MVKTSFSYSYAILAASSSETSLSLLFVILVISFLCIYASYFGFNIDGLEIDLMTEIG
jgi:LytS/YehU family sensor histidine kinase